VDSILGLLLILKTLEQWRIVLQKAIALISGGLDSATAIAVAQADHDVKVEIGVSILYGQRHDREVRAAEEVANYYGIRHFTVDIRGLGDIISKSSALLNKNEALPHDRALSEMTARVPRTYVPGRNTIMLAIAQSIAEAYELSTIVTGFNAVDFSGYPDCRPVFVEAWNYLARYATRRGYQDNRPITVLAPIINKSKASVVAIALELGVPLQLTWSCYLGQDKACGRCDSCRIRLDAFKENHMEDPVEYA
jgi:7-cyano-7-deazaguanine synthase